MEQILFVLCETFDVTRIPLLSSIAEDSGQLLWHRVNWHAFPV